MDLPLFEIVTEKRILPLFEKSGAKTFLWDFVAESCANRVALQHITVFSPF